MQNYEITACELTQKNAKTITFETGMMAEQASGAVIARSGDSVVLVAVVASKEPKEGTDFLPLTVDYVAKSYAAGKIPGGFFKREGKPSTEEILACRLIDRPLRPMFPDNYFNDLQVSALVLSYDDTCPVDVLAVNAASAAFMVSEVPIVDAVAAVRVGKVNGELVLNPSETLLNNSTIVMTVAGTQEAITMVEAGSKEVSEEELLEALAFAHEAIKQIAAAQKELAQKAGKPKTELPEPPRDQPVREAVGAFYDRMKDALHTADKIERNEKFRVINIDLQNLLIERLGEDEGKKKMPVAAAMMDSMTQFEMRRMIFEEERRIDGRKLNEVRPISCITGLLPRTHGSSLFTRGQTQSLGVVTLGGSSDALIIDNLEPESKKPFYLHYNFPSFSTGEARSMRSPGRREIGHGALAEKALAQVMPSQKDFPYSVRVVSEILSSNGSSSMASVCSGSMALMDAGVPIKAPVAGIAMGLIKDGDRFKILTDILGDEDHFGDMDFKVAGTENGVNALQMDIKIIGVTLDIMKTALQQAKEGRLHILSKMAEAITEPKGLSKYAPRVINLQIDPEKIRTLIGPGGKTIRAITDETGVKIDTFDDGRVLIMSPDQKSNDRALELVKLHTDEAEVGKVYTGTVKRIMNFGAFVEILPGTEGLVHISQLDNKRVNKVEDVVNIGDELKVKVIEIDSQGRVNLSRKVLFAPEND